MIKQQQSLESSFQGVPEFQDVPALWPPADALQACLNSYVLKLNTDMIPSWQRGGLEHELTKDMTRGAIKCASPWFEAKRHVTFPSDPSQPSPSFPGWSWLPVGCLMAFVIMYLSLRHGVQSGTHAQCNGVLQQSEPQAQSIHREQMGNGRLISPTASSIVRDEVEGARQRLRSERSRTPPGSENRTKRSPSISKDDHVIKVKARSGSLPASPKMIKTKDSVLQTDAGILMHSLTSTLTLQQELVVPDWIGHSRLQDS